MKLVTLDDVDPGSPGALLSSGEILHLGRAALEGTLERWLPGSVRALLEAGGEGMAVLGGMVLRAESAAEPTLQEWRRHGVLLPADTRLKAPVPDARLIVAAGLAYRSHLAEMGNTPAPPHPTGFIKSTHSIAGPSAPLPLPAQAAGHVDYEGELAVVFGRRCHNASVQDAMDHVAGYTVANDVSARDWLGDVLNARSTWEARLSWEVNIMGKQFPGFTCLGPALVTRDEIEDVGQLRLETRLNGHVVQAAPISDMIFSFAEMIAYFSKWYVFEPGDILLTGTPAGVGAGRKPPLYLEAGDIIEVSISSLGTLRTPVVAART